MKKEVTRLWGAKVTAGSELVSYLLMGQPFISKFGKLENQFSNAHFELNSVLGTLQCHLIFSIVLSNKNDGCFIGQEIEI